MTVSIFDTMTMRAAIERKPPLRTALMDTYFSDFNTHDTEKVLVDIKKGNRKLAPFVHPLIGGQIIFDSGYKTEEYKPPLIAPENVTTADQLLKRQHGEVIGSSTSPVQRAAKKLGSDLQRQTEQIIRRIEWMCSKAIFDGVIPVVGKGINEVIDFEFTNKETLLGSDRFSDPSCDPIAWIDEKVKVVQKTGFVNPTDVLMADDVMSAFLNNPKVKDQFDNRRIKSGEIDPKQLPNGMTYMGTLSKSGLDLFTYNEWYQDDWTDPENPVEKPLVPDGHVAIMSRRSTNSIEYGAITRINSKTEEWETHEGKIIPDSWVKKDPDGRMLKCESRPLPIPHEVNSWFVGKVL